MCPVMLLAAPCPAGLTNPTMPLYKIPTKKPARQDEAEGLIVLVLALVAVPPAAWMLAAIFNALIF